MDEQQLLRQYAEGKRNFTRANLKGMDLPRAKLAAINLSRANLAFANLRGADLSEANLVKANLTKADLTGAKLTGVNLAQANLTGAAVDLAAMADHHLVGAILPDGTLKASPLGLPEEELDSSEVESQTPTPPTVEGLAADLLAVPVGGQSEYPNSGHSNSVNSSVHYPVERGQSMPRQGRQSQTRRAAAHRTQPRLPQSPRVHKTLFQRIPWRLLLLFAVGYSFLGLFLYLYQAPFLAWGLLWLSSLIWLFGEEFLWFMPIAAAIATLLGAGISVAAVFTAAVIAVVLILALRVMGWSNRRALRDAIWIGGIAAISVAVTPFFFSNGGVPEGGQGLLPLGLMILLGGLSIGFGTASQVYLKAAQFSTVERLLALTTAAIAGSLLGSLVGFLTLLSVS